MRLRPLDYGLAAANLVPLVGVLALDWSLLEAVAWFWLEAAAFAFFAGARTPWTSSWWSLLVAPAYYAFMSVALVLAFLLLTLAFFVMRFQEDFFGIIAEGTAAVEQLGVAAFVLVAWQLASLLDFRRHGERTLRAALVPPTLHALALLALSVASVYVVRDLRSPLLAVALIVVAKTALDLALAAFEGPRAA